MVKLYTNLGLIKKPQVDFLIEFSCVTHVNKLRNSLKKLNDRSIPRIFIGYEKAPKAIEPITLPHRLFTSHET